jgi:hypothetical protein
MDGTPDNDHGANSVNALQSMLLQSDGKKIYLLPAWPEDWDVTFKLFASDNMSVECVYRGGRVTSLKVTPESRRADVVDFSSLENRIRTLVGVACNDRNHLFDLPPMLDGLPKPGPTTAAWLAKYGESITGMKGAPWPDCTVRDNVLYVFSFHGQPGIPEIPATLISKKWLTKPDEKPVAILRLEFDRPLDLLVEAAPSAGSLTQGRAVTRSALGVFQVDLGETREFERVEFTIENPGHRRGKGTKFELQSQQADGSWKTFHQGQVFGSIYTKQFKPVSARVVRLVMDVATLKQLDLFPKTSQP